MTLEDLLWKHEQDILRIKKRLYYLKAILTEVNKVTDRKPFTIRNDILWQMVVDSYDMLVIDLASFYRGMCESGGFFGHLRQHSSRFQRTSHRKIEAPEPNIIESPGMRSSDQDRERLRREIKEDTQRFLAKGIEEALLDLFPELKEAEIKKANHDHVEALKNRFWELSVEMVRDRDSKRAHRFEKKDGGAEELKEMTLERIEDHFRRLERMMNAIRVVATNSSLAYLDMNHSNVEVTARDVTDIVMIGGINQVVKKVGIPKVLEQQVNRPKHYHVYRDEFYRANPAPFGRESDAEEDAD